jgi:putative phosphoesterase
MKCLILSDIHGNLPALELVLKKETSVEQVVNLGDVVNYGPWSNECVELIETIDNCINIRGNHEDYFLKGKCECGSDLVEEFFKHCYSDFNNLDKIQSYESEITISGFTLTHTIGSNEYVFKDSAVDCSQNYIIGHSHQQYQRRLSNNMRLINPGSVGQNRNLINLANYAIWDIPKQEFLLKEIEFNIDLLINEMKIRNFPKNCIDYYSYKERV